MQAQWLSKKRREEIKNVFEPRYRRKLTNHEVELIADNLTAVIEEIIKYQWIKKNGKQI